MSKPEWIRVAESILTPFETTCCNWTNYIVQAELLAALQFLAQYPFIVAMGMKWFRNLITLRQQLRSQYYYLKNPTEVPSLTLTTNEVDRLFCDAYSQPPDSRVPSVFGHGFFGPRRLIQAIADAPHPSKNGKIVLVNEGDAVDTRRILNGLALGYVTRDQFSRADSSMDELLSDVLAMGGHMDLGYLLLKHGRPMTQARTSQQVPHATASLCGSLAVLIQQPEEFTSDRKHDGHTGTGANIRDALVEATVHHGARASTMPVWRYVLDTAGTLVFDPARHANVTFSRLLESGRAGSNDGEALFRHLVLDRGGKEHLTHPLEGSKKNQFLIHHAIRSSTLNVVTFMVENGAARVYSSDTDEAPPAPAIMQLATTHIFGLLSHQAFPTLFEKLDRFTPRKLSRVNLLARLACEERDRHKMETPRIAEYIITHCDQEPRSTIVFINLLAAENFPLVAHLVKIICERAEQEGGERGRRAAEKEVNGAMCVACAYIGKESVLESLLITFGPKKDAQGQEEKEGEQRPSRFYQDVDEKGFSGETALEVTERLGFNTLWCRFKGLVEKEREDST